MRVVQVWFQNRRLVENALFKKKERKHIYLFVQNIRKYYSAEVGIHYIHVKWQYIASYIWTVRMHSFLCRKEDVHTSRIDVDLFNRPILMVQLGTSV